MKRLGSMLKNSFFIKRVKSTKSNLGTACCAVVLLLALMAVQSRGDTLLMEDFCTDVIASGDWTASDASVHVDTENGWLHIGTDGAWDDFADKLVNLSPPIVVETRMRLVSGGQNYTVPNFGFFWGPTNSEAAYITYLPNIGPSDHSGWLFGSQWTDVHTMGPTAENQWITIRAIVRADGGELFAKADGDPMFTPIVSGVWSIPSEIVRIRLVQNWDAVCDYDYVHVTTLDQQAKGWCDDFESGLVNWDPYQYPSGWTPTSLDPHWGQAYAAFTFPEGAGYYDASMRSTTGLFNVEAGVTYRVTWWMRELNTHDTWDPNASILDMNLIDGGANNRVAPFLLPISSEWYLVDGTVTASVTGPASIDVQLHGYATSSDAVFAIDDICVAPLVLPENADLSGFVTGPSVGLLGVPVDLVDTDGNLYATTTTDNAGFYQMLAVPNGSYTVSISTPLGYMADPEAKELNVLGQPLQVDFALAKLDIRACPRSRAYWAAQINRVLIGRPQDYTKAQFSKFGGLIDQHFNGNPINPVENYVVPQPASQIDSLKVLSKLLNFQCIEANEPFLKRIARGELVALMLNVVAGKVSQTKEITKDGMTLSQAITYCDMLVNDLECPVGVVPPGYMSEYPRLTEILRYIKASFVAGLINVGVTLPTGTIPPDIMNIAYKYQQEDKALPAGFALAQNYPNPFNPVTEIAFAVPVACDVTLEVFNVLGQKVATLVDGRFDAGEHSVTWDASTRSSGVYLYRITAGEVVETKKMMLLK